MDHHPPNPLNQAPAGRPTAQPVDPVQALLDRHPHLFAGPLISLDIYRGWFPVLQRLCTDIDATLGDNKTAFRWVQIKEKFGTYRLYYKLRDDAPMPYVAMPGAGHVRLRRTPGGSSTEPEVSLAHRIRALVSEAEDATSALCMACGRPAQVRSYGGNYLNLCDRHAPDMGIPEDDPRYAVMWDRLWQAVLMPGTNAADPQHSGP